MLNDSRLLGADIKEIVQNLEPRTNSPQTPTTLGEKSVRKMSFDDLILTLRLILHFTFCLSLSFFNKYPFTDTLPIVDT